MEAPRTVKLVKVVQVCFKRGSGTDADPVRLVNQYWSIKGQLLAENDPGNEELSQLTTRYPVSFEVSSESGE